MNKNGNNIKNNLNFLTNNNPEKDILQKHDLLRKEYSNFIRYSRNGDELSLNSSLNNDQLNESSMNERSKMRHEWEKYTSMGPIENFLHFVDPEIKKYNEELENKGGELLDELENKTIDQNLDVENLISEVQGQVEKAKMSKEETNELISHVNKIYQKLEMKEDINKSRKGSTLNLRTIIKLKTTLTRKSRLIKKIIEKRHSAPGYRNLNLKKQTTLHSNIKDKSFDKDLKVDDGKSNKKGNKKFKRNSTNTFRRRLDQKNEKSSTTNLAKSILVKENDEIEETDSDKKKDGSFKRSSLQAIREKKIKKKNYSEKNSIIGSANSKKFNSRTPSPKKNQLDVASSGHHRIKISISRISRNGSKVKNDILEEPDVSSSTLSNSFNIFDDYNKNKNKQGREDDEGGFDIKDLVESDLSFGDSQSSSLGVERSGIASKEKTTTKKPNIAKKKSLNNSESNKELQADKKSIQKSLTPESTYEKAENKSKIRGDKNSKWAPKKSGSLRVKEIIFAHFKEDSNSNGYIPGINDSDSSISEKVNEIKEYEKKLNFSNFNKSNKIVKPSYKMIRKHYQENIRRFKSMKNKKKKKVTYGKDFKEIWDNLIKIQNLYENQKKDISLIFSEKEILYKPNPKAVFFSRVNNNIPFKLSSNYWLKARFEDFLLETLCYNKIVKKKKIDELKKNNELRNLFFLKNRKFISLVHDSLNKKPVLRRKALDYVFSKNIDKEFQPLKKTNRQENKIVNSLNKKLKPNKNPSGLQRAILPDFAPKKQNFNRSISSSLLSNKIIRFGSDNINRRKIRAKNNSMSSRNFFQLTQVHNLRNYSKSNSRHKLVKNNTSRCTFQLPNILLTKKFEKNLTEDKLYNKIKVSRSKNNDIKAQLLKNGKSINYWMRYLEKKYDKPEKTNRIILNNLQFWISLVDINDIHYLADLLKIKKYGNHSEYDMFWIAGLLLHFLKFDNEGKKFNLKELNSSATFLIYFKKIISTQRKSRTNLFKYEKASFKQIVEKGLAWVGFKEDQLNENSWIFYNFKSNEHREELDEIDQNLLAKYFNY